MGHYTQEPDTIPAPDRERYIQDNAVALVAERDETIRRLRKELATLNSQNTGLRKCNLLLSKGMESQCEEADRLKQRARGAEALVERLRLENTDLRRQVVEMERQDDAV